MPAAHISPGASIIVPVIVYAKILALVDGFFKTAHPFKCSERLCKNFAVEKKAVTDSFDDRSYSVFWWSYCSGDSADFVFS